MYTYRFIPFFDADCYVVAGGLMLKDQDNFQAVRRASLGVCPDNATNTMNFAKVWAEWCSYACIPTFSVTPIVTYKATCMVPTFNMTPIVTYDATCMVPTFNMTYIVTYDATCMALDRGQDDSPVQGEGTRHKVCLSWGGSS